MKILFIGGTGIISSACSREALARGMELTLLNRGTSVRPIPEGARTITADYRNPQSVEAALGNLTFDAVVDWIAYTPDQVKQDLTWFKQRAGQYIFISSASAYQTPPTSLPVRESTILDNPYWEYSRNKIACEGLLVDAYRAEKYPITIVRPSHTYDETLLPFHGGWTMMDRMLKGQPVIVHGDGTSLWTLTHHDDFARGFIGLLGNSHAIGQAVHITSDEWLNWNQIYELLAAAIGVTPHLVHVPSELIRAYDPAWGDSLVGDKSASMVFDNSLIKSLVPDYCARIPFSLGARQIAAWYLADPTRQKVDPVFNELIDRILTGYQKAWPSSQ
jgi:nucleoside-diphosphate-sugar epimerase